jgi:hypothetical protein
MALDAYAIPGRPERCDCGAVHPPDTEPLQLCDAFIATGGSRLGEVNLPDGSQYLVPRRYIAAHGIAARDVVRLATRYGWQRTR